MTTMPRSPRVRRALVGLPVGVALAIVATLVSAQPGSAGAQDRAAVPVLHWTNSCQGEPKGFTCTTAKVPLDYNQPRGRLISIAMIKHPATDRRHRAGTLFFNSGGPGNALTQFLPALYDRFPAQVRQRFDIVGFDPRGVGDSTAVQCFPNAAAEGAFMSGLPAGYPVGSKQEKTTLAIYAGLAKQCGAHAGPLLSHVSTANTARDLDLLRQAVGDPKLNYYGLSYGTFLGATYANLFPGKVHAMILDAVLEPVDYTTGRGEQAQRLGAGLRLGAPAATTAALNRFLALCGKADPAHCAFSAGSPAGTRQKYTRLMNKLRGHPVTVGGQTYTLPATVATITPALEAVNRIPVAEDMGWPDAANLLQQLWKASTAPVVAAPKPAATAPTGYQKYAGFEQGGAIICSESTNPRDQASYPRQAAQAAVRYGDIGRAEAWRLAPCATWPVTDPDRYTGPWNRRTAAPIMVIGNTYDPVDAYRNAVTLSRELGRARLLTVDGYGHGALQNKSSCANDYEVDYLLGGKLPANGAVCHQDKAPFTG